MRWLEGTAGGLVNEHADLVTMTGNVAQVFVSDDDWLTTLRALQWVLTPRGHLMFEARDPGRRAWLEWDREHSYASSDLPGVGVVERWVEVTEVSGELVSLRWTFHFASNGEVLTSDSTLRFRDRRQLEASLEAAGFVVSEVREAPDRPGHELVFIAQALDEDWS